MIPKPQDAPDPAGVDTVGDPLRLALTDGVEKMVSAVRGHLDMDVAFVSEFVGEDRVFRHVASRNGRSPIARGDTAPLTTGYCKKIIDGALPQLIPDTAAVPAAMAIPETHAVPIGAHISVPLRLSDGRVYGTFCCFSFNADVSLNERDLKMMRAFAELISIQIDGDVDRMQARKAKVERLTSALAAGQPTMVYQPVFRLSDRSVDGAEALARFQIEPVRSPDQWFAEAAENGLRTQLELQAVANAITGFERLFSETAACLKVNVSPQTMMDDDVASVLAAAPATRLVLEITEHEHVEDYPALLQALEPLRERGVRVAVDDAGAGYASLRHILNLRPDIIKLDISLTQSINTDPLKHALARALISFAEEIGSRVIAEGIETAEELDALHRLGVHSGQGYFLGRPMPPGALIDLVKQGSGRV
ncbi:Phytochrome-like protein cph2 [Brevundimonas sp. SH203]|uniref:sensor domain-containing phosphodiesterase n=1 Tax=Brevundimonas sp. SH203 TaxID=345167 RepID=UPI0009D31B53|nr:EAL domain-containing protein [Brevundimonas sp. SH203]GAW40631.1 Phytochrome-like protein cph2 [Brevundimonas sp. SH203]